MHLRTVAPALARAPSAQAPTQSEPTVRQGERISEVRAHFGKNEQEEQEEQGSKGARERGSESLPPREQSRK